MGRRGEMAGAREHLQGPIFFGNRAAQETGTFAARHRIWYNNDNHFGLNILDILD